jgi:hypothetical protein
MDFNWSWLLQAAGALVLIGGAIAVMVKGARWAVGILRKISEFLEDWRGEPARPGYAKRPGVMERLVDLEKEVRGVSHELKPNAGGSMKDQITRIEEHNVPPESIPPPGHG